MVADAIAAHDPALIAALEKRLGLRRRARSDGAAGKPATGDPPPGDAETDIAAAIDAERAPLLAERARIAVDLEHAARRLIAPADSLAAHAASARLGLRQLEGRLRRDLGDAARRADETAGDLRRFRAEENVRWRARYPQSLTLSTGLLAALVAVEAIASAPIFASALDGGLAQGYMIAVVLSALNASIGLIGGYFGIRYLQRRSPTLKALGAVCALAAAGAGLFFNGFAAVWRARSLESMQRADPAQFDAEALAGDRGVFALLFDTQHGETFILLVLGLIVLIGAFVKGATGLDDPVPDHGALTRAAETDAEDYRDAEADAQDALDAVIAEARTRIDADLATRRDAMAALREKYDSADERIHAIDRRLRDLAAAEVALVETYRIANSAARKSPPPDWFLRPPAPHPPPPDALERAGALRTEAEAALAAAVDGARREIEALIAASDDIAARLPGRSA